MLSDEVVEVVRGKYERLSGYLNEQTRRVWAAVEAQALGRGGVSAVARATGLSRTTVHAGIECVGRGQGRETQP